MLNLNEYLPLVIIERPFWKLGVSKFTPIFNYKRKHKYFDSLLPLTTYSFLKLSKTKMLSYVYATKHNLK